MKMRMPSVPLITVDPYFSVWSRDEINRRWPVHWTGSRNAILGTVTVDGETLRFLGGGEGEAIEQKSLDIDAVSTTAVFANEKIELTARLLSPLLITDLYYASRPVSYLELSYKSLDGSEHDVRAKVSVSEELVLNRAGEGRACSRGVPLANGACVCMGSGAQKVLWRSGDDVRIDWGYLYLAVRGAAETGNEVFEDLYAVYAETELRPSALFAFGYDDISSLVYFGEPVKAYWKKDGRTIDQVMDEALSDYEEISARCEKFSREMLGEAERKGGEKYREILALAYRQVMAAHKLALDPEGNVLYISKECFSNGCAATVDLTYPSAPLYLRYNTELLRGMLRPVLKYARSDAWEFDFAPHDVGQYPLLNGQVYGNNQLEYQMPVEESGNILIVVAAMCERDGNADFAAENMDLLDKWSRYLDRYGLDPENQLCTDDFAGHLAHNVNLTIKAAMGMAGYAKILARLGRADEAKKAEAKSREFAESMLRRAANEDGSFRLAFDRPDTFSLKYNAVWDLLWGTKLFPESFYAGELARYRHEALPYGVPLDDRERYTKSDWEMWVACFGSREDFEFFADLLWRAYDTMRTRVPLTDWYYADTSEQRGFQHRTAQGGLFMRLMME